MPTKVLFLIDTLEVGGAERSLLDILRRFKRIQPVICHLYRGSSLKSKFVQAGIPVVSLDLSGPYNLLRATAEVAAVVAREKPDLIHSTLFRADVVARLVARRTGLPLVSSFVNDSYSPSRIRRMSARQRLKLWVVQVVDAVTSRWVDGFVANSEAVRRSNAAALRVPLFRVTTIPRGREVGAFRLGSALEVAAVRQELGLRRDAPVLLNVARLLDRKGQEELIYAFARVVESVPTARLLIAGDGPHRPVLEELIRRHSLVDAVHLLGTRSDVPTLLQAADLFVFPSHYEGIPGALLEAMLAARPIVASDIPVHRESLDDGVTGLLFRVGSADSLAEAILAMLQDPSKARTMGNAAREVASVRYDIELIARRYEDYYCALLGIEADARLAVEHSEAACAAEV